MDFQRGVQRRAAAAQPAAAAQLAGHPGTERLGHAGAGVLVQGLDRVSLPAAVVGAAEVAATVERLVDEAHREDVVTAGVGPARREQRVEQGLDHRRSELIHDRHGVGLLVLRVAGRGEEPVRAGGVPGPQRRQHLVHAGRLVPPVHRAQQRRQDGEAVQVLAGRGLHRLHQVGPGDLPVVQGELVADLRGEHLHPVHRPVPVLAVGGGEQRGRLVVPAVEEPLRRVDLVHVLGAAQEARATRTLPVAPGGQVGVDVRGPHRVQAADVVGDVLVVDVEPVERVVDLGGARHPRLRAVGQRGLAEAQEADHRVHVVVEGGALVHHGHRLAAHGGGPALDDAVHGQVDLVVERLPADGPSGNCSLTIGMHLPLNS